jgi:ABC-2 type transport system permease protein
VFVSPDAPGAQDDALNIDEPITSGLSQLLFLYPGGIRNLGARDLEFTPLARAGDRTGTMRFSELRENQRDPRLLNFLRSQRFTQKRYVIGARIRGFLKDDLTMSDAQSPLLVAQAMPGTTVPTDSATVDSDVAAGDRESNIKSSPDEAREKEIHVVYVADIDLISSEFLQLRAQPDPELKWDFDNVTFVLNILDSLAGDESLIDIRKRKTRHSTLKLVELQTEVARDDAMQEISEFDTKFQEAQDQARERLSQDNKQLENKILELQKKAEEEGQSQTPELISEMTRLGIQQKVVAKKLQAEIEKLERERDRRLQVIQNNLAMQVRKVQTQYKLYAAFLPLIPPFIVGLLVWNARAKRENISVGTDRLR